MRERGLFFGSFFEGTQLFITLKLLWGNALARGLQLMRVFPQGAYAWGLNFELLLPFYSGFRSHGIDVPGGGFCLLELQLLLQVLHYELLLLVLQ